MLVIKNADIITMAAVGRLRGDIYVDGGVIQRVAPPTAPPEGAQVLDATGLVATPGWIDAHTHLGCFAGGAQNANETSAPANAELDIFDSFAPSAAQRAALEAGITTAAVLPGGSAFLGGLGCVVKTYGESAAGMVMVRGACMKASFSLSVSRYFGTRPGGPATVMGHAQQLRQWLRRAQRYATGHIEGAGDDEAALRNLVPVVAGEIPLRFHCESYNIMNILHIAEEFGIRFTLEHAYGASAFVEEIAAAKGLQGVVFGPLYAPQLPGISREVKNTAALELHERGVPVAIMSDYMPATNCGTLEYQAGELVRRGCAPETALHMLTAGAARILGVQDRVGSIEPGKDADIVLFRGMPLRDTAARVAYVVAGGKPLTE